MERRLIKSEHLDDLGVNEVVNTDVRPIATVTSRQQVHCVEVVVAGADVHSERFLIHAIQTTVHYQLTSCTIETEQIAARCNVLITIITIIVKKPSLRYTVKVRPVKQQRSFCYVTSRVVNFPEI